MHELHLKRLIEEDIDPSSMTPQEALDKQWELLDHGLRLSVQNGAKGYRLSLSHLVQKLNSFPLFHNFQLWSALKALNAYLSGVWHEQLKPTVGPSGAAPLDSLGYWTWAQAPLQPYHTELGLVWAILGHLTNNQHLLDSAQRIATWQLNILGTDLKQQTGLFCQKFQAPKQGTSSLLNIAAGLFCQDPSLLAYGKEMLHQDPVDQRLETIQTWLQQFPHPETEAAPPLPSRIFDPHMALIGYRKPHFSVWSTLSGAATGLGSMRHGDVELTTYGPQHLPLSLPDGFGIQGETKIESTLKAERDRFLLRGRAQLTPSPTTFRDPALYRHNPISGTWLDVQQELSPECLTLSCHFHSLQEQKELAFSFFFKGSKCKLDDGSLIESHSNQKYIGAVQPLKVCGSDASIYLSPIVRRGKMQVTSLEDPNRNWGANFLITTIMVPTISRYHWRIIPTFS